MPVSDPLLKNLGKLHLGRPQQGTPTHWARKIVVARKIAGDTGSDTTDRVCLARRQTPPLPEIFESEFILPIDL